MRRGILLVLLLAFGIVSSVEAQSWGSGFVTCILKKSSSLRLSVDDNQSETERMEQRAEPRTTDYVTTGK